MKEKKNSIFKGFMIVLITALITCVLTTIVTYSFFIAKTGNQIIIKTRSGKDNVFSTALNNVATAIAGNKDTKKIYLNDKFSEIKSKIDQLYIGEVNEEKMVEGALEGYVSALGDEYTEYLNKEEVESLMQDVKGSYVGVGLYIAQNTQTNQIIVVGVIEDSPAHKAGVLVGDIIKKVDDVEYKGDEVTQASNHMKGIAGTKAKLTIERNGNDMDFEMIRSTIKFKCIKSEMIENNIGYIKISSFDGGCANDFKKAYQELNGKGIKGLVIDLRNNGGGLVDQALDIADMIVPKGATMLITEDKNKKEEVSKSEHDPSITVPVTILVNGYTASASEILTAAVRENVSTAKVVGTQTYGKGIIQGVYLLNDQKTGMKITIQEYFTPSRAKLHKIGIKPDIELELPDDVNGQLTVEREKDNQLNKAIELMK